MVVVFGEEMKPGCYVAGHHGQYGLDAMAAIADSVLGTNYADAVAQARRMDDFDALVGDTDEALDALNDVTTGGYWEWVEGELFLTEDGEDD